MTEPGQARHSLSFRVGFDREVNASFKLFTVPGGNQPSAPDLTEPILQGKTVWDGKVQGWQRAAVFSAGNGSARFFELEPAAEPAEVRFHSFHVRGHFKIRKVNNPRAAREEWEAFRRIASVVTT